MVDYPLSEDNPALMISSTRRMLLAITVLSDERRKMSLFSFLCCAFNLVFQPFRQPTAWHFCFIKVSSRLSCDVCVCIVCDSNASLGYKSCGWLIKISLKLVLSTVIISCYGRLWCALITVTMVTGDGKHKNRICACDSFVHTESIRAAVWMYI